MTENPTCVGIFADDVGKIVCKIQVRVLRVESAKQYVCWPDHLRKTLRKELHLVFPIALVLLPFGEFAFVEVRSNDFDCSNPQPTGAEKRVVTTKVPL